MSGFSTRKQEQQYDNALLDICELMSYKIINLMKICDYHRIDLEGNQEPKDAHLIWTVKFLEIFKQIYKLEKYKY